MVSSKNGGNTLYLKSEFIMTARTKFLPNLFADEATAEEYEYPLIFIGAHFAWYQDGELIYEQEG